MTEMNPFILANSSKLKSFIDKISSREGKDEDPVKIDLPLELELLKEHFNKNKVKMLTANAPPIIQALFETLNELNQVHKKREEEEQANSANKKLSSLRKPSNANV